MEEFISKYPNLWQQFDNVFVTADQHYGHKNILEFEPVREEVMLEQGFTGTHEEFIIHNWNEQVGEDDLVIHLGDIAFKALEELFSNLNGTILLVLGNHDRNPQTYSRFPNVYVVDGFWSLDGLPKKWYYKTQDPLFSGLFIGGRLYSHYPIYSKDKYDLRNDRIMSRIEGLKKVLFDIGVDGVVNVHGHSHTQGEAHLNSINVCIDNCRFVMPKLKESSKERFK